MSDDETRTNAQEKRSTVNQMLGGGSGGGSGDSLKPAEVAARKARCGHHCDKPVGLNRFGFPLRFASAAVAGPASLAESD